MSNNEVPPTEVASRIKNTIDYPSDSYTRYEMTRVIFFAAFHRELNALFRIDPKLYIDTGSYEINLTCSTRESTLTALNIFAVPGVNWDRDADDEGHIRYSKEFDMSFVGLRPDMHLNISGTPPASCKIVEEEVLMPAYKRMVKRVVCKDGDDVKTNQDPDPNTAPSTTAVETVTEDAVNAEPPSF